MKTIIILFLALAASAQAASLTIIGPVLSTNFVAQDTIVSNGLSTRLENTNTALRSLITSSLTNIPASALENPLTSIVVSNLYTKFTNSVLMTRSDGALTNVTVGSGLSLSGTTLSATGGGGESRSVLTFGFSGNPDLANNSHQPLPLGMISSLPGAEPYCRAPISPGWSYATNLSVIFSDGSPPNYSTNYCYFWIMTNTVASSNAMTAWLPFSDTAFGVTYASSSGSVSLVGVTNITVYVSTTNNPTTARPFTGSITLVK